MFKTMLRAFILCACGLLGGVAAQADPVPLADTQDAFTYQFLSSFAYDPALDSFFPNILAVANDSPSTHSVDSYIEFGGLATSGLTAGDVTKATFTLNVTNGVSFGDAVSSSEPVTIDLYAAGAGWTPSTIDWMNQPAAATGLSGQLNAAGLLGQFTVTSPSTTSVTFNVTSTVQEWLNGGLANNGFIIAQDNSNNASLAFDSRTAGGGQPLLTINPVPEPSSLLLALAAFGAVVALWSVRALRRVSSI